MQHTSTIDLFIINYNKAPFLRTTVESVLSQTYPDKKVILSDDASTDKSLETVSDLVHTGLEIRKRTTSSGGVFQHTNLCIAESTAEYVGILHADDLYSPSMVQKQIDFLRQRPDVGAVLTAGEAIDEKGHKLWPLQIPGSVYTPKLNNNAIYRFIMKYGNSFFICPSAIYRTSVLKELGEFRIDLPQSADLEMFLRILFSRHALGYINEPLIQFRMSASQTSGTYDRQKTDHSDFFTAMDLYLEKAVINSEDKIGYEALRKLDRYQAGLNQLAMGMESKMFSDNLNWLLQNKRIIFKNLGGVDRLRIAGGSLILPVCHTKMGQSMAKMLIQETDPRSGIFLRSALKLKRKFKSA